MTALSRPKMGLVCFTSQPAGREKGNMPVLFEMDNLAVEHVTSVHISVPITWSHGLIKLEGRVVNVSLAKIFIIKESRSGY